MEQGEIYDSAIGILNTIREIPLKHLRLDEALFLFRHCMMLADGGLNVIAAFGEPELQILVKIAQAISARFEQTVH